jgi:hypothetical protein
MEWTLAGPVPGDKRIAMNGSVEMKGLVTFGHDAPAGSIDQHSDTVGNFGREACCSAATPRGIPSRVLGRCPVDAPESTR